MAGPGQEEGELTVHLSGEEVLIEQARRACLHDMATGRYYMARQLPATGDGFSATSSVADTPTP